MADMQELRAAPRFNCYSLSTSDDNAECGLVIDISETGAGLTISKDTPLFMDADSKQSENNYDCLYLNIFHPDYEIENSLNIKANIAWLDSEYSKDRFKLGVHFSEIDDSKSGSVSDFIDWIQKKENYFLRCKLEKCS